ncbi:MAG: CPBP family intramembrane glutamic endopeptidase [Myxococcota bacterium]
MLPEHEPTAAPEAPLPEPTFRERLAPLFEGLGGEPTVILCGASAFLIVSHYQGSAGFFRTLVGSSLDQHPWNAVFGHLWWFATSIALYLFMPLVLALATKGSFNERYGFQLGDWRAGLKITVLLLAIMLPATWVASKLDSFKGMYPLAGNAAYMVNLGGGKTELSWSVFLTYELGYLLYFVAWEFLFRGWMIHGLTPSWGRAPAILAQVVPFAVMHLGKAELEALGSIIAGVALGILSIRTRSFWYGALIHGVVALWMDWLSAKGALLGA